MRFISNGDYLLPLHFSTYWAQHVYTWSYERGAANPDGILRLPGRLMDIAAFAVVGNVGFGYFYLATCFAIAFLSFAWFASRFLGATRPGTVWLAALFFAFNPIFLGNSSKVGLILAVAMLPIALTALKQGFATKRFSYFLLVIVALNVSLLHPYTFAVNALVCLGYAVFLVHRNRAFARDSIWKFALLGLVALLLNMYAILPLASLRTLDKSALTDTVSSEPTDYTSLVDIANTGDIFTGMSLSKNVLKDYEFYSPMTWPFYFMGIFLFYALLLGVYLRVEKQANPHERRRFVIAMSIFLGLLVLATASYLYADVLIKFLIGLPGGWMFRSPLKWQLYMPVALFAALVIALKLVRDGRRLRWLYTAFGLSFVLMNAYLFKQVFDRLLTPRNVTHFAALYETDMQQKNLLFADSSTCMTLAQTYPEVATELNQVLVSKPVQVKHVQAAKLDSVNLSQYDFVFGCSGAMHGALLAEYGFTLQDTFREGSYLLYRNTAPAPYVGATSQVFAVDAKVQGLSGLSAAAASMDSPFHFTDGTAVPTPRLKDLFANLTPDSLQTGEVAVAEQAHEGEQRLHILPGSPVFYTQTDSKIRLSSIQTPDSQPATEWLSLQSGAVTATYEDPTFNPKNLLSNPSLEEGLWQETVGDCNAYDDKASLSMNLAMEDKTKGKQALQLGARAHIACTGPASVLVEPGQRYLLSFDYKTLGGRYAGYHIQFNDPENSSVNARLDDSDGKWQQLNTEIEVPAGSTEARLVVYAYPDSLPGRSGEALYDNFSFVAIPALSGRFFLLTGEAPAGEEPTVEYKVVNPTKTAVTIKGAAAPFYLTTKESYHRLWQARAGQYVLPNHVRLNGTMNGWYINPSEICKQLPCTERTSGGYDIALTLEFAPQRWFYIGAVISAITALGAGTYVVYEQHHWRGKKGRRP